ncbi:unnamed protein product, partial [Iphiclides podalirius]
MAVEKVSAVDWKKFFGDWFKSMKGWWREFCEKISCHVASPSALSRPIVKVKNKPKLTYLTSARGVSKE